MERRVILNMLIMMSNAILHAKRPLAQFIEKYVISFIIFYFSINKKNLIENLQFNNTYSLIITFYNR